MTDNSASGEANRRAYKRVHAPVYCRPAGLAFKFLQPKQKPLDISLGGMRIYSDEPMKKGTKLELELFLPDNSSVTCKVEVVWTEELPAGSPAKHDVGLRFIELKKEDQGRLAAILDET